jgi:hypothetical protein
MRGSVKLVQIKGPNTGWETMNNVWGASWEATSVPDPPLDFRIQDDTGTEVRHPTRSPAADVKTLCMHGAGASM